MYYSTSNDYLFYSLLTFTRYNRAPYCIHAKQTVFKRKCLLNIDYNSSNERLFPAERLHDLVADLQGPPGPQGVGKPGRSGNPGPPGPEGKIFRHVHTFRIVKSWTGIATREDQHIPWTVKLCPCSYVQKPRRFVKQTAHVRLYINRQRKFEPIYVALCHRQRHPGPPSS